MPRLHLQDLEFDDDHEGPNGEYIVEPDTPTFEPIRRSSDPVSGKHDLQRRSENGLNRYRKARKEKERDRA